MSAADYAKDHPELISAHAIGWALIAGGITATAITKQKRWAIAGGVAGFLVAASGQVAFDETLQKQAKKLLKA